MQIVMLLFPDLTQLDLTGPFEVFGSFRECQIDLVWKTRDPVRDARGLGILPTATFDACPQADILFVPGGPGQLSLMDDGETLGFLKDQARGARFVTSVCTGSLVLGAAGLLAGYRATSHWLSLPQLALLGAEPVSERVVVDRNRVTGAGVTSGIDFALTLMGMVFGEERARAAQLRMEYDPHPPFRSGHPREADPVLVSKAEGAAKPFQGKREIAARQAGERLGLKV